MKYSIKSRGVVAMIELKDDKLTNNTDKIIDAFKTIKSQFSENVDGALSKSLQNLADKSEKVAKPLKEMQKSTKGTAAVVGALALGTANLTKIII